MTELIKYLIFIGASMLMGLTMWLVPDVAETCSIFYVSILSTFLGLDIANTLKHTNGLPEGQFKGLKASRYITSSIFLLILFIYAMVQIKMNQVNLSVSVTSFGSALFLIGSLYIGGLEGNKLLTWTGAPQATPPEKKVDDV